MKGVLSIVLRAQVRWKRADYSFLSGHQALKTVMSGNIWTCRAAADGQARNTSRHLVTLTRV